MKNDNEFRVGVSKELIRELGSERPTWNIQLKDVPEVFRNLIPLAEKWGISDDLLRSRLVEQSSPDERRLLIQAIEPHEYTILEWLAGPEAQGPNYSDAYVAFSVMLRAYDEAKLI